MPRADVKKKTLKTPRGDPDRAKLKVKVTYAPSPDVGERVSRAINILLKSAARQGAGKEIQEKEDDG